MRLNAAMIQPYKKTAGHKPTLPVTHEDMLRAVATNRDRASFIGLFEYFAPRIKSFLMKGGTSEAQADELAQDTMLSVWQKAGSYNPAQAAASTWIFTIARNKKIDTLRKNRHFHVDIDEIMPIVDEKPDPNQNMTRTEEQVGLAEAIKKLSPEQARLIEKSFFEEKSHAVIAQEEDLPLGTVKSRIRLALDHLRRETEVKNLWN